MTGQCGLGFAPMKPEQFEDSIKINSGIFGDYRHYLKGWTTFGENAYTEYSGFYEEYGT